MNLAYHIDVDKPVGELTDLEKKYLRNRTPQQRVVDAAFYKFAGDIIDNQIQYTPEQEGRFNMTTLDGKNPLIQFAVFSDETIFEIHSLNHSVVRLGLKAAAAAISLCSTNWVMLQAHEAGRHGEFLTAEKNYNALFQHIFHTHTFTKDEQAQIRRYID